MRSFVVNKGKNDVFFVRRIIICYIFAALNQILQKNDNRSYILVVAHTHNSIVVGRIPLCAIA